MDMWEKRRSPSRWRLNVAAAIIVHNIPSIRLFIPQYELDSAGGLAGPWPPTPVLSCTL